MIQDCGLPETKAVRERLSERRMNTDSPTLEREVVEGERSENRTQAVLG